MFFLHCAGGMQMYFLKKGLDFAFDLSTFAMGLLICFMANTPSLAAGNTPITIASARLLLSNHSIKSRTDQGWCIKYIVLFLP